MLLRAINDGGARVEGISGVYHARNIDGGAEVLDAAGSGRVHALERHLYRFLKRSKWGATAR
ncbi:MAG: hypothetical protein ACM3ZB_11635 [bacterium]